MEKELSSRLQANVHIGKFDFIWPHQLKFFDVTAENVEGKKLNIAEMTIDTSLTSLLAGNLSAATIHLSQIKALEKEFAYLTAQLNFDSLSGRWKYSVRGQESMENQITANGAFLIKDDGPEFELSSCKLGSQNQCLQLEHPMLINVQSESFSATPARLSYGNTFVDLQLAGDSKFFNAKINCHVPSIESLAWSLPDVSWSGECAVSVDVGGPWGSPVVHGSVAFRNGSYEHLISGSSFKQINGDFDINNDGMTLKSFTAEDLLGGHLTARGKLNFDPELHLPFNINLHLDRAAIVNLEEAHCYVSGEAQFLGDRFSGTLNGKLNVDQVNVFLKDGKSSKIHGYEVTYINQSIQEKSYAVSPKANVDWPLHLNVDLKNTGTISISDANLTSQWKGEVSLTGTTENPLVQGDCRLEEGNYLFNGKKFKMAQGTISFNGDPEKKTQIYVVAVQEVDSIQVEVILKGPLNDLSLAFRSTPPLPEKEILSRLLFGRGTGEITSFEGAELTESINKLKSQGGDSPNFLNSFMKKMGLDRIEISRDGIVDNEELSLQVGKYLSPGVFIGVKKGITTDANRIGIEADLKRNLKIQAEIGDDSVGHLHLKWKHDY